MFQAIERKNVQIRELQRRLQELEGYGLATAPAAMSLGVAGAGASAAGTGVSAPGFALGLGAGQGAATVGAGGLLGRLEEAQGALAAAEGRCRQLQATVQRKDALVKEQRERLEQQVRCRQGGMVGWWSGGVVE